MFSEKLKQYRLSKGYSLDDLVAKTGGLVSKVSLSKYERGIMRPTARVLAALARALDVKIAYLVGTQNFETKVLAFRKGSISQKEEERLVNNVKTSMEERVRIQDIISPSIRPDLPLYSVKSILDAERAAEELREHWKLGTDPIPNLISVLESRHIHVFLIEAPDSFDGTCAKCTEVDGSLKAVGLISRKSVCGERQRFNLAHELGHTVLEIDPELNEETVAHRFASAFLAPKDEMLLRFRPPRTEIQLEEFLINKRYFGMSMQALLYRLKDLNYITREYSSYWWKNIIALGYKKNEPCELTAEAPTLFKSYIYYALSEKLISTEEAVKLSGDITAQVPQSIIRKREFLKLSPQEKAKILSEQSEKMLHFYQNDNDWKDFSIGVIYDYDTNN